jgi:hypothetical protein
MSSRSTAASTASKLEDLRVQVIALVPASERIRLDRFIAKKGISRAAALRDALRAFLDAAGAR